VEASSNILPRLLASADLFTTDRAERGPTASRRS